MAVTVDRPGTEAKAGPGSDANEEGCHELPQACKDAVARFEGKWPLLVDAAAHSLKSIFRMDQAMLEDIKADAEDSVICSVSDPSVKDCPLVYFTRSFEEKTGYPRSVGYGRNCRFLQPKTPGLNQAINGAEITKMRAFVQHQGAEVRGGANLVSLLLNERRTGERFWNLLYMQYVLVEGRHYLLGMQIFLDSKIPTMLRSADMSQATQRHDEAHFSCFLDELHIFLTQLRAEVRGEVLTNIRETEEMVTSSLLSFMKRNSTDYEGDHWVPVVGMARATMFQEEVKWNGVVEVVHSTLVKVWEVSSVADDSVACAVSDPCGEDCPVVYISREFEKLTGYPREWVLGRNCRFLQPNDAHRNKTFNQGDCLRMREFCKEPKPVGTRLVNFLVNEHRNGYPFWNLLVMEHIQCNVVPRPGVASVAAGIVREKTRPYIFGVQTAVDIEEFKLAELLAMDEEGIRQLTRLREILRAREYRLDGRPLKVYARECIKEWAMSLPSILKVPRLPFRRVPVVGEERHSIPLVGLEINSRTLFKLVPPALEEGVRHFYLSMTEDERNQADTRIIELQVRLLALRLAELLTFLQKSYYHYLRASIAFTFLTPPLFAEHVGDIVKCLRSHGYRLDCWMMDLRGMDAKRLAQAPTPLDCWQSMSQAYKSSEALALGVCGGNRDIFADLHRQPANGVPVACWGMELYPGRSFGNHKDVNFLEQLMSSDVTIIAYTVYGPKESLLDSMRLQMEAKSMGADPAFLLMKWAEAQGFALMAPKLRALPRPGTADTVPDSPKADGEAPAGTPALAKVHRSFVKEFKDTPTAKQLFKMIQAEAEAAPAQQIAGFPKRRLSMTDAMTASVSLPDAPKGGYSRRHTYGFDIPGLDRGDRPTDTNGCYRSDVLDQAPQSPSTSSRRPSVRIMPTASEVTRQAEMGYKTSVTSRRQSTGSAALMTPRSPMSGVGSEGVSSPSRRHSVHTPRVGSIFRAMGASIATSFGAVSPLSPKSPSPRAEGGGVFQKPGEFDVRCLEAAARASTAEGG